MRIRIGTKLMAGFILVLLLMVALALYSVRASQKSLQESVGNNSISLAEEILNRIEQSIYLKMEELQRHSKNHMLQKTILESNIEFEKLDNIQEYINQEDREWVSTQKDEITPFMKELVSNELSCYLRERWIQYYEKKYGYPVLIVFFVTNKYGANVAQTGKRTDYRQDDEEWWQVARERGFYIGDVEYDEWAKTHGICIGVRVDNSEGKFIGVIKAIIAAKEIIREAEITLTKKYETTQIKLMTKDGRLIYATKAFKFLENISGKEFFNKIRGRSGFFIAREGGRERLFSYVHSKGYGDFKGHKWIFVVEHDTDEVLKPAFVLRNTLMAAFLILLILGIAIALLMSHFITKSLTGIRDAAVEIAQGNLDLRIDITSTDEIGELGHAFNDMASKLKTSYSGLEEKIHDRTKQLEKANKELRREITERKKAEEELAKHRDHLEELIRERTSELEKRVSEVEQLNSAMVNLMEDLRISNRNLEITTLRLGDANKELEAFAYSVSHDLRAPLRAIDGFSQSLLEDYSDSLDDQGKHYLQRVRAGTQNMGQLIDDILNLSRIGRQPVKKEKVNLEIIIREAYRSLEDEWKDREVNFTVHECPSGFGDPHLMKIVFVNLFSNALKFTRDRETAEIEVGSKTEDKQTTFFVKDNGTGFNMKYADKLFTPFQRLHRVEEYEGTGIGLAIVQRIIIRHGGSIRVESELNVGTAFYFSLPRS